MFKYLSLLFMLTSTISLADPIIIQIPHNDENALANAITEANNNPNNTYVLEIVDNDGFGFVISTKLPIVTGNVTLQTKTGDNGVTFTSSGNYDGRFLQVSGNGNLTVKNIAKVSNFHSISGGGFIAEGFAIISFNGLDFENLTADDNGGAVVCAEDANCIFDNTTFTDCDAGGSGGAVSCLGDCEFNNVTFDGTSAEVFACGVDAPFGSHVDINQCSIRDPNNNCTTNYFDVNGGVFELSDCHVFTDNDTPFASCTGNCELQNNIFEDGPGFKKTTNKTVCNDFGTAAFHSLGYNIDSGSGCFLDHVTDLVNTNPMVTIDSNGIPQPNVGSPLIETGPVNFVNNVLPCPYKDMNGLGRPQDFDGDGVFACDRGPVEIQGGADLTNAQSGLYFDVDRNGEGIILEMLSASSALITMFTYAPNKTDLMWFIGVGNVVGNSVVIDNIQSTSGGVFGSNFDASAIVRNDVGSLSVIFPDCNASDNPGRMVFESKSPFKQTLENLLVKSTRLSRLLNCDQTQPNPQSGRSGAFYDPSRSGEGIFVQVLDRDSAVVIFYTYTPDGKQFWLISSDVQITNNMISANMVYPASTTGFGNGFNASEINLLPWGILTLEYQPGCSQVNMAYDSTISGYGSGMHPYQRLTQPAGITCDL
jgi:hypothetical protein